MNEEQHLHVLKTKLWKCGWLVVLAYAPPLFALTCIAMPAYEDPATWFQRSGSTMVVISLLAEFKLFSIQAYFDHHDTAMFAIIIPPKAYKNAHKIIVTSATVSIVIGTIIWGYGDIVIKSA
ncbi:hypothetical protein KA005_67575 [bacterium]|nr:hypothetical protein [bacterium]